MEETVPVRPYSEGIHPWDAGTIVNIDRLLDSMLTDDMVAVGEIGLDKLHPDYPRQEELFGRQLEIARERKLPVIIHCVKAFEDIMSILTGFRLPCVIFHSYIGSVQQTERILNSGYYISLGDVSLESPKTVESVLGFSLDRLFIETDDTGLPIDTVYSKAARVLGIRIEELSRAIYDNYSRAFLKE